MKKLLFKCWIVHFLVSIGLYISYRIVIAETESADDNWLEAFLYIIELLLHLGFAAVYLLAMVISSGTIFLNLVKNISNNFYLSFLTFSGLPLTAVLSILIIQLTQYRPARDGVWTTLLFFSIVYLFFTVAAYFLFRKKMSNRH